MSLRPLVQLAIAVGVVLAVPLACSGGQRPELPAPRYQEPELPSWEPPAGDPGDDFDPDALAGEWVDEAPALGGQGGGGSQR